MGSNINKEFNFSQRSTQYECVKEYYENGCFKQPNRTTYNRDF